MALFKNLSIALIMHKRINTTLAKAKNLRVQLEPLVTKAKDNTQHSRRTVFAYLQNNDAVSELFDTIGPKVADRPGGYLRIIKTGFRKGDGAETALIEFVDFNDVYTAKPASAAGKKKVRRGRAKATASAAPATESESAATETAAEESAE